MLNRQALVFDLDDTLYPEAIYFASILAVFCSNHGWPNSSFAFLMDNFRHFRNSQSDLFSFFLDQNIDLWENGSGAANCPFKESCHLELFELYTSIQCRLKPHDGAATLMKSAHDSGLRVGVLTNGVPTAQRNKWKCLDIPYKEDVIFVPARECRREKPAPDSFHVLSQYLDVGLDRSIFIGDRYENDLLYPLSQGAVGILLQEGGENICVHENCFHASDLASVHLLIEKIINLGAL